MSAIKDGGPAFPQNAEQFHFHPGMSLRDYFAAKAMQALLVEPQTLYPANRAQEAYEMADAMLAAREVKP